MPFLDRDGCTLYYEMSPGPSRPVVLIHGWCCDHSYLAPQASHFAGRGHLVVSLDLRGHGRSGRPHQAYPIGGFADDVAWLCGALNLSKPILIGHSMGGIVAFDIAARYPDLPGAIAMLDSAIVLPEATRAAIPAFLERLRGPDYVATLRAYVKERLLLPTDDAVRSAAILEGMGEATQFVAAASFEGLGDYDSSAARGRVKVPALYIAADEPVPRCDMEGLFDLLPGLRYGQTVGSGHFCQLEVPDQVNAMIDRFVTLARL